MALQKAIIESVNHISSYLSLIGREKKDDAAIKKLLDTMVPKFPDNPQLHMMLANLYLKKGELDKAESKMLKIAESQKESVPFRLMLANFYTKQQLFDKAEETLKSALKDFPDDLQLQVALGELSFDLQKLDQARSIMETVLKTNPANGGANLIKARFLIKDGKNNEAGREANLALRISQRLG